MSLESLLKKRDDVHSKAEEGREQVILQERGVDAVERGIKDQISSDFAKFVKGLNKTLPEDKRVTRWHVNYDGGIKRAFITIMDLGGKGYESENVSWRDPVPYYLKGVERFAQGYPVKVIFDMQNHSYLDCSLDELK